MVRIRFLSTPSCPRKRGQRTLVRALVPFVNKLNVQELELALEKEYQLSAERILELSVKPISVHSMKDVCKIHHFIFQDMYEWSGGYRTVGISKSGNAFMAREAFDTGESYINTLV